MRVALFNPDHFGEQNSAYFLLEVKVLKKLWMISPCKFDPESGILKSNKVELYRRSKADNKWRGGLTESL